MLGRTANGIFWMFRYIERSENIARLIDAGIHMALTCYDSADDEWSSVILSAGVSDGYYSVHDEATEAKVIDYLLRDKSNPSSIVNSVDVARNNARMVRTALTRESWESVNEFWLDTKKALRRPVSGTNLPEVLDLIKRHAAHIRGSFHGTMLRNEIFDFSKLGTYMERADNTARILDVKYYVLLPSVSYVGSSLDNTQWDSILRSVSAHKSFRWMYGSDLSAANIADYLILNERMPRSLSFCYNKIYGSLENLARDYGERSAVHTLVETCRATIKNRTISDIFDQGLHEFLQAFITLNGQVGGKIAETYRFY